MIDYNQLALYYFITFSSKNELIFAFLCGMKQRTMTIILAVTLIILIVFVYLYSVPPKGTKIGPPASDTTALVLDTVSHAMAIEK